MRGLTGIKKIVIVFVLLSLALPAASACQVPGDAEIIEGILERVDEMNGEMTIVTKDGETVTIKITKESQPDDTDAAGNKLEVGSEVKLETDKDNIVRKEADLLETTDRLLDNILPPLDTAEDTFEVLGVADKALALRERGLTWSHIARELSYTEDRMYAEIKEEAVVVLERASADGSMDAEMRDKLLVRFLGKAEERINDIFSDRSASSIDVVDINTILPPLGSFEDVFKALGVWEKAADLRELGLTWSHVARELDYGLDSMHIRLREVADDYLERAYKADLITRDQWERMYVEFDELALKWVREIFSDENTLDAAGKNDSQDTDDTGVPAAADVLPALEDMESVFRMLDGWEKAIDLHEAGLTWAQVAREMGYTEDSMLAVLNQVAGTLLEFALNNNLITKEQYERESRDFEETARKWVREIFGSDTANLGPTGLPETDTDPTGATQAD